MHRNIMLEEAHIAAKFIKDSFADIPNTGIILGSGFGGFASRFKVIKTLRYEEIPFFPPSNIMGHKGAFTTLEIMPGKNLLVMEGRFHYYEGYSIKQVTFPISVLHALGIQNLMITNAAGGINLDFKVGDLMIIEDHINFTGINPLIGKNNDIAGPRFLDQTEPYNKNLIDIAKSVASRLGIKVQKGVYLGLSGSTYETKAEIKAFRVLGADAVGMSTVPEVIIANYFGIKVLGISSITNMATGIAKEKHDHSAILESAKKTEEVFTNWICEIIMKI